MSRLLRQDKSDRSRGDARNKERKLLSRDESSRSESRIQSSAACLQLGPGLSDRLTDKRGKEDSGCLVQQQGLPRLQVAAKEAQRFESWDPEGWNEMYGVIDAVNQSGRKRKRRRV